MRRLSLVALLVLLVAACGDDDTVLPTDGTEAPATTSSEEPSDTTAPPATEAPEEVADSTERGPTWFEVSGDAEVSAPEATAHLRFEEFSETWLMTLRADLDGELHNLAFRFQDGFTPDPGSYEINFDAQPVVATYAPPGSGNSEFFDELQGGTFEVTGNDGTTLSGTFSYEASVDDTGAQTVAVEGAFEVEIGDAFGPPPSE